MPISLRIHKQIVIYTYYSDTKSSDTWHNVGEIRFIVGEHGNMPSERSQKQEVTYYMISFKRNIQALTGVARFVGHHPEKRKVTSLIPAGHIPGLWVPCQGVYKRQLINNLLHCCFSSFLSLSPQLSLKINK